VASRRLFVDITPLRQSRDYRLIWLSQLATGGGRQIVVVAVPYQVYLLTHSSLAVGLLGLAFGLVGFVAMVAYLIAGPDGMAVGQPRALAPASRPSTLAPTR